MKRLFIVLRGDCNLIFSVYSELFYSVILEVSAFLDLQLFVECWFPIVGSYENMQVIRLCFYYLFRFAISGSFWCLVWSKMYIVECDGDYTLGCFCGEVINGSGRISHHGRKGSAAYATPIYSNKFIAFAEKLVTRILNGHDCRTSATPWASYVIWRVSVNLLGFMVLIPGVIVVT